MIKLNDVVTALKLKKEFGPRAVEVLRNNFLAMVPRTKGTPQRYEVIQDLPTPEEYSAMETAKYTATVQDLVGEAWGEIESLADEMRTWYDNLPEGLQQADKGERINAAADTLENIQLPDAPDGMDKVTTIYFPGQPNSRADRASEAVAQLRSAAEAIHDNEEDKEGREEWSSYADELNAVADELEGVEFPGMFG